MNEIRMAFTELYGLGDARRVDRPAVPVDPATLGTLTGRYETVAGADTLRFDVSVVQGALQVYGHAGKRSYTLVPSGTDTFFDPNTNGAFTFERDAANAGRPAVAMRLGTGPASRRAARVP